MSDASLIFTHKGIAAAKAGNLHLARQFFEAAVQVDPRDGLAWLWMSGVVTTPDEKRNCLRQVLSIDPGNAAARRGLDLLGPERPMQFAAGVPATAPVEERPAMVPARSDAASRPARAPRPPAAAPASPPAGRSMARIALVLLAIVALGALVVIAIVALGNRPTPAAPIAASPAVTVARPPTWMPEPTPTPQPTPTPRPAPEQLQPMIEEAIRVRELEPLETIRYILSAQFDLDLYLSTDLDNQDVVAANAFWEEMRALGLVDFDMEFDRQALIDATSQQLGGFYSIDDQTLYAVTQSSRIEPSEYPVIVHEYTHALTDMHFDLSRLYRVGEVTTDADLAARALAEGDATLVENLSSWGSFGPQGWDAYARAAVATPPLLRRTGVSPALRQINAFPYVEGWEFVWNLRESGGWNAVNLAYAKIPSSTEQILHGEKYAAGEDAPREVTLPDVAMPEGREYELAIGDDTLGEYVTRLLLDDFLDDAERAEAAAAGWGGDALRVWRDPVGRLSVVWLTAWDSEDDAREFRSAAADMMAGRTGNPLPADPDLESAYFDGELGSAYVSRNGDQVLVMWSPDSVFRDAILAAFPDF